MAESGLQAGQSSDCPEHLSGQLRHLGGLLVAPLPTRSEGPVGADVDSRGRAAVGGLDPATGGIGVLRRRGGARVGGATPRHRGGGRRGRGAGAVGGGSASSFGEPLFLGGAHERRRAATSSAAAAEGACEAGFRGRRRRGSFRSARKAAHGEGQGLARRLWRGRVGRGQPARAPTGRPGHAGAQLARHRDEAIDWRRAPCRSARISPRVGRAWNRIV
mmetsp:Transcript_149825/g.481272  ORF Transcript_149825/g.481272 Transcript_149825/m.481272 type:complete len:218 (-) Transcript_149825:5-658(-)